MKKVFEVLLVLSFIYVLGVVGSLEKEIIGINGGLIRIGISLGCIILFFCLAVAFDSEYIDNQKKRVRKRRASDKRRF